MESLAKKLKKKEVICITPRAIGKASPFRDDLREQPWGCATETRTPLPLLRDTLEELYVFRMWKGMSRELIGRGRRKSFFDAWNARNFGEVRVEEFQEKVLYNVIVLEAKDGLFWTWNDCFLGCKSLMVDLSLLFVCSWKCLWRIKVNKGVFSLHTLPFEEDQRWSLLHRLVIRARSFMDDICGHKFSTFSAEFQSSVWLSCNNIAISSEENSWKLRQKMKTTGKAMRPISISHSIVPLKLAVTTLNRIADKVILSLPSNWHQVQGEKKWRMNEEPLDLDPRSSPLSLLVIWWSFRPR